MTRVRHAHLVIAIDAKTAAEDKGCSILHSHLLQGHDGWSSFAMQTVALATLAVVTLKVGLTREWWR